MVADATQCRRFRIPPSPPIYYCHPFDSNAFEIQLTASSQYSPILISSPRMHAIATLIKVGHVPAIAKKMEGTMADRKKQTRQAPDVRIEFRRMTGTTYSVIKERDGKAVADAIQQRAMANVR